MDDHFIHVLGFAEPLKLDETMFNYDRIDEIRQTIAGTAKNPTRVVVVPRRDGKLMIPMSAVVALESRPKNLI